MHTDPVLSPWGLTATTFFAWFWADTWIYHEYQRSLLHAFQCTLVRIIVLLTAYRIVTAAVTNTIVCNDHCFFSVHVVAMTTMCTTQQRIITLWYATFYMLCNIYEKLSWFNRIGEFQNGCFSNSVVFSAIEGTEATLWQQVRLVQTSAWLGYIKRS